MPRKPHRCGRANPPSPVQAGLTLVELVVAVPLAAGISLMAFFAVRAAMQTARLVQNATEENAALRAGWFLAMDEADHWSSHASPDFPYLRGYMSTPRNDDTASDKCLFRPMRLAMRLYGDGTDLHPHDQRSWYVGPPMTGVHTTTLSFLSNSINGYAEVSPYNYQCVGNRKDPLTTPDGIWSQGDYWAPNVPVIPTGWEGWHIHGDYASISNLKTSFSSIAGETTQQAMLRIYARIGHLGVASYMSPGSLAFAVTDPVNRSAANIGKPDKRWGWGEMPWSLTPNVSKVLVPLKSDLPKDDPDPNLTHFALGLPGQNVPVRMIPQVDTDTAGGRDWAISLTSNDITRGAIFFPGDYQTPLNQADGVSTVAAIYPARSFYNLTGTPIFDSSGKAIGSAPGWDAQTSLDSLHIYPYRLMNDPTYARTMKYGDLSFMEKRNSVSTSFAPAIPSDPRSSPRDSAPISLRLRVLRTNQLGYDRLNARVVIARPDTGKGYEMEITPLGSSFRGARWIWGLRTNGRIGDQGGTLP